MLIKRLIFCLFIIGVISTIAGFYILRNSVKEINIYKNGKIVANISKKDFSQIQREIENYANNGHKTQNGFIKKDDIYKMKETGSGVEIIYIEKTPSSLYIPVDENGNLLYIVYAGSDALYIDQPEWTSEEKLTSLQSIVKNALENENRKESQ